MATKNLKKSPKDVPAKTVVEPDKDKERETQAAIVSLRPSCNAAAVMLEYGKVFGEQNISELTAQLIISMEDLKANDLTRCENMLFAQAQTLQSMFTHLSRRAIGQEYMKNIEGFLRLALKAQNQCRMTLETLANIKNPPVVYAKQANIAHGHQQVNNGTPAPAHAEKNQTAPNELLEADNLEQQRLDTGAPGKASRTDQAMAPMDKFHRAYNRSRKG